MNVTSWKNVDHTRGSLNLPTRFSTRLSIEVFRAHSNNPCRKKSSSLKSISRSLRCGCYLEASTTVEEIVHSEKTISSNVDPPTFVKAPGRIIAIGDLHGDLRKTIRALELAEVVTQDENGMPRWSGGNSTIVQLGDVLDRGDCEIGILMLLRDLHHQAEQEGGAVYMINGNHESLNVCGNFRYVTRGAFYECALAAGLTNELSLNWDDQLKARLELYSPGGLVANELAKNPTVLVVNETIFAHGGLLPIHVNYGLERINREMSAWMRGDILPTGNKATPPYIAMGGPNSILWNRTLAQEQFNTPYERYYACSLIKSVLKKVKAKRLVVGHTPQMCGCNAECGGQIWRVDVGMSEGVMNADPQVISIREDEVGKTLVEIVNSASNPLSSPCHSKKNNIQSTVGFESIPVQGHRKTLKWMSKRLMSRLNAEAL